MIVINRIQIVAQKICLPAEDYSQIVPISKGKIGRKYTFISANVKNFIWYLIYIFMLISNVILYKENIITLILQMRK